MTNIIYKKRAQRIRSKLKRNNTERLRLTIFRSSKNIYAQIIDDAKKVTLISATSAKKNSVKKKKADVAIMVAEMLAKKALDKKITKVYFDRGSYRYHGRIKIFAETLRKGGLTF